MHIELENPDVADVRAMLGRLDAYCAALYPAESNHLMDIETLTRPEVRFLVARDAGRRALGCGAVVRHEGYGEIKRMFVDDAARGQGIGRALLARLAVHAQAAGLGVLKLETGVHQPEAIALYERFGFTRCPPFGEYGPDPLSIFMEKRL